jgi:hypothetical protein
VCNPIKMLSFAAGPIEGMLAGGLGKKQEPQAVVVGAPPKVTTQIGDTGAAAVATARKPKSLLSAAGAAGDLGGASVGYAALKPTLGA